MAGAETSGSNQQNAHHAGRVITALCSDTDKQVVIRIDMGNKSVLEKVTVVSLPPFSCTLNYTDGQVGTVTDSQSCDIPIIGSTMESIIMRESVTISGQQVQWGSIPVHPTPLAAESYESFDLSQNIWTDAGMNDHRCRRSHLD